jgi:hypothetical protein
MTIGEQMRVLRERTKLLIIEMLTYQFAYRIIEEDVDVNILKVAEEKVEYLKNQK